MVLPLWFILTFWMLVVIGYVFIAGMTYKICLRSLKKNCEKCSSPNRSCSKAHDIPAFFLAAPWPLGIPLALGLKLADKIADAFDK